MTSSRVSSEMPFYVWNRKTTDGESIEFFERKGSVLCRLWDRDRQIHRLKEEYPVTKAALKAIPTLYQGKIGENLKKAIRWMNHQGYRLYFRSGQEICFDTNGIFGERDITGNYKSVDSYDGWKNSCKDVLFLSDGSLLRVPMLGRSLKFLEFSETGECKCKSFKPDLGKGVVTLPDGVVIEYDLKVSNWSSEIFFEKVEIRDRNTSPKGSTSKSPLSLKHTLYLYHMEIPIYEEKEVEGGRTVKFSDGSVVTIRKGGRLEITDQKTGKKHKLLKEIDFVDKFTEEKLFCSSKENLVIVDLKTRKIDQQFNLRSCSRETVVSFKLQEDVVLIIDRENAKHRIALWHIGRNQFEVLALRGFELFSFGGIEIIDDSLLLRFSDRSKNVTIFRIDTNLKYAIRSLSRSSSAHRPTKNRLVHGCQDGTIRIYDLESLSCMEVLYAHRSKVTYVRELPDGRIYSEAEDDACFMVWSLKERKFSKPKVQVKLEKDLSTVTREDIKYCIEETLSSFLNKSKVESDITLESLSFDQQRKFEEIVEHRIQEFADRILGPTFKIEERASSSSTAREERREGELKVVREKLRELQDHLDSMTPKVRALYEQYQVEEALLLEKMELQKPESVHIFYSTVEREFGCKLFGSMVLHSKLVKRAEVKSDLIASGIGKLTKEIVSAISLVAAITSFGASFFLGEAVAIGAEVSIESGLKEPANRKAQKKARNVTTSLNAFQNAMDIAELIARRLAQFHMEYIATLNSKTACESAMNAVDVMYSYIASGGFKNDLEKDKKKPLELLINVVEEQAMREKRRFRIFGAKRGGIFPQAIRPLGASSAFREKHRNPETPATNPRLVDMWSMRGQIREMNRTVAVLKGENASLRDELSKKTLEYKEMNGKIAHLEEESRRTQELIQTFIHKMESS